MALPVSEHAFRHFLGLKRYAILFEASVIEHAAPRAAVVTSF